MGTGLWFGGVSRGCSAWLAGSLQRMGREWFQEWLSKSNPTTRSHEHSIIAVLYYFFNDLCLPSHE